MQVLPVLDSLMEPLSVARRTTQRAARSSAV